MSEYKFALRCPYCDLEFEASPPDKWHSAYSFDEPIMSSFHGEVKLEKHVCKNPSCKKSIMVYWYAPMEYFNRM
jgi:hypothetical protein